MVNISSKIRLPSVIICVANAWFSKAIQNWYTSRQKNMRNTKFPSFVDHSSAWCFCVADAGQWFDSSECYFAIAPRRSQRNWKWSWNAQSCLRTMMRLRRGVWIRLELAWLLWFHTSKNVLKRQISSTDRDAVASRFRACPEKARNIGLSSYNSLKNVVMKQAFETWKSHLSMVKRLRRGVWTWPKGARNIGLTLY